MIPTKQQVTNFYNENGLAKTKEHGITKTMKHFGIRSKSTVYHIRDKFEK